jgi:hypothetical protein
VGIESRRYFSRKLRETVADDRRLNRYYSRDVIAPRFLKSWMLRAFGSMPFRSRRVENAVYRVR